jgi:hypothetical protein
MITGHSLPLAKVKLNGSSLPRRLRARRVVVPTSTASARRKPTTERERTVLGHRSGSVPEDTDTLLLCAAVASNLLNIYSLFINFIFLKVTGYYRRSMLRRAASTDRDSRGKLGSELPKVEGGSCFCESAF